MDGRLKVGYRTEFRCQHQPACFSSTLKLSDTAYLVGMGVRGGGSPQMGNML